MVMHDGKNRDSVRLDAIQNAIRKTTDEASVAFVLVLRARLDRHRSQFKNTGKISSLPDVTTAQCCPNVVEPVGIVEGQVGDQPVSESVNSTSTSAT